MPPMSQGYVRVGIIKELPSVLEELGSNPREIIGQAGIDPGIFSNGDNIIPFTAMGELFALCVARTKCPHFGLLVGQRASVSSLGLIGGLMLHSQSVGEALRNLVSHIPLHERGSALSLASYGDVAVLSYAIYEPGVRSTDQIADAALAVVMKIMWTLCGSEWAPEEVLLPRHAPADTQPYRKLFRSPVRFDRETAALTFPARWLEREVEGADPVFHQIFEARIRELENAHPNRLKDDLRRVLRTKIMTGRCSAETVADLLAMHRRTLSRHLRAEGTGFRHLSDEIRFEIARQLLTDTEIPLGQIAVALGYSEASAFTRAFRRWAGVPPTAWRAEHQCSCRVAEVNRAA